MSKVNIYVNSKNRKSDETPSNFSVIIPDGLHRGAESCRLFQKSA